MVNENTLDKWNKNISTFSLRNNYFKIIKHYRGYKWQLFILKIFLFNYLVFIIPSSIYHINSRLF